jgi:cell division protein FtsN
MAGGSRRFEFGWLEVFGLILVFLGGSLVVFFLGIFVGKGLQESRLAREERVERLPIDPASMGRTGTASRSVPAAPADPAVPGAEPSSGLQLAVRPAPSPSEPAPTASPSPTAAASPKPTEPRAVVPSPTASAPTQVVAAPTAGRDSAIVGAPRGRWSVQVNATKDAYTARRIVQRLRQRGYNAYAIEVVYRDEPVYRVRVGRFPTMESATAVLVRLKNEEQFTRAYLAEE